MSDARSFIRVMAALPWVALLASSCKGDQGSSPTTAAPSASVSVAAVASSAPVAAAPAGSWGGPAASAGPRLAAISWETTVRERPSDTAKPLGYLRAGAIVSASEKPVGTAGCAAGWYEIAPQGFVCSDPSNATTDLNHELVRALSRRPDTKAAMPYLYGIVRRGGPIFGRLPTREQAEATEPGLEARMREWLAAEGENGAGFRADYWLRGSSAPPPPSPLELWEKKVTAEVPWYLEGGRLPPGNLSGWGQGEGVVLNKTKHHNGFAFVDTAVVDGRRYAISTQLFAMPVDRLRPIEGSSYHGVEIPGDIEMPFALIRREGAALFREDHGKLVKERDLERRAAVKLSGKQKMIGSHLHFETADGLWVSDKYASRLDPAKKMPRWAKKGERWLDVNITKQVLVAYDGTRPVFATLVSTGEAGLGDPETSKATKRGIFRIHAKHLTATMDSDVVGEEFELRDIPYVQYFEGGYALHAAYWHDDFGKPRSHGCINLAPQDARRLFFFTEPALPDGWHHVRRALTGSVVFVHP
jgi:hypothetical protein